MEEDKKEKRDIKKKLYFISWGIGILFTILVTLAGVFGVKNRKK